MTRRRCGICEEEMKPPGYTVTAAMMCRSVKLSVVKTRDGGEYCTPYCAAIAAGKRIKDLTSRLPGPTEGCFCGAPRVGDE